MAFAGAGQRFRVLRGALLQAAGGSAGLSGSGNLVGAAEEAAADGRDGRRRELSFRNGNASAAPTRLRFAGALSVASDDEE